MAPLLLGVSSSVCSSPPRLFQANQTNSVRPLLQQHRCTTPRTYIFKRHSALAMAQQCAATRISPAAAHAAAVLWPVTQLLSAIKQAFSNLAKDVDMEDLTRQAKVLHKQFKVYRMVLPFAAVSSTTNTFILVSKAIGSFVKLYLLLLFVRVLLSWFPNFSWENQPWLALRQVTDPYLNLFRGLVPPLMGSMDFTPLFGFLILQFLAAALELDDGSESDW